LVTWKKDSLEYFEPSASGSLNAPQAEPEMETDPEPGFVIICKSNGLKTIFKF
jgi:hypothetical protein